MVAEPVEGSGGEGGGEANATGSAEENAGGGEDEGGGGPHQMPAFIAQSQTQRAIWAPYGDANAEEDDSFEGGVGLRLQASSSWSGFSIV